MGTNYYHHEKPACPCCERDYEARHIGKSSGGWVFSLHIYPEDEINTYEDWEKVFSKLGTIIKNEYGEVITPDLMRDTITKRERWNGNPLMRHHLDGQFCLAHGPGTWDYMVGEFS